MDNRRLAATFDKIADLLSGRRAAPHRIRSYRNLARTLREAPDDVSKLLAQGADPTVLPGVGETLGAQIRELATTGTLALLQELAGDDLEAVEAQIAGSGQDVEHVLLSVALRLQGRLLQHLEGAEGLTRIEPAGDARRYRETVRSLIFVAVSSRPSAILDRLADYPGVLVAARTRTLMRASLREGLTVELRLVEASDFGVALVQYTGSTAHAAGLMERIGSLAGAESDAPGDASETSVYRRLGLPSIAPELREGRGEIEAAENGTLPRLLEPGDIRGDLQMHSTWSDGRNTIEEMVAACEALGYEYMAITDHSRSLTVAGGLDERRLRLQAGEIERVRQRHPGIRILHGAEVEILPDGALDFPDEVLAGLDLVVAAVHSRFDLPAAVQTQRILRALENPQVDVLAHPTGRKIDRRRPMRMDLDEVLACAAENHVAVELNALPRRLDLKDTQVRRACQLGAMVVIDTDAHSVDDLANMALGVAQARRGWLGANDLLNALPLGDLLQRLGLEPTDTTRGGGG